MLQHPIIFVNMSQWAYPTAEIVFFNFITLKIFSKFYLVTFLKVIVIYFKIYHWLILKKLQQDLWLHQKSITEMSILILSWQRLLSDRNQSIDLLGKSMVWFLYDNGLRHERVKY